MLQAVLEPDVPSEAPWLQFYLGADVGLPAPSGSGYVSATAAMNSAIADRLVPVGPRLSSGWTRSLLHVALGPRRRRRSGLDLAEESAA